jgi:hypothetical protein
LFLSLSFLSFFSSQFEISQSIKQDVLQALAGMAWQQHAVEDTVDERAVAERAGRGGPVPNAIAVQLV